MSDLDHYDDGEPSEAEQEAYQELMDEFDKIEEDAQKEQDEREES